MNIHWLGSNVMCIGTKLKIIWACANPQFFFGSHLLGQFFSHVFIHTEKVGPSIREVMNGIGLRVHLKIAWSKILCLIITSKKELAIQGYPLCLDTHVVRHAAWVCSFWACLRFRPTAIVGYDPVVG